MTGGGSETRRAMGVAILAVACVCGPAEADAGGMTGSHSSSHSSLVILEGTTSSVVEFTGGYPTAGGSVGTCECTFRAVAAGAGRWRLEGTSAATLSVDGRELVIAGDLAGCCGLGWPGIDRIPIGPKPLPACRVKAKKAVFRDPAAKETMSKAYVVAGDTVLAHVDSTGAEYVPAVFVGAKSRTAGLLRRSELDCAASAKGAR